ncbi:hypothetical protein [Desulfoluna butyratoxydans]|uniref:Uncharacterized protein n=1 Tax=Desulfoluna butyratoxydans TaxID=231438 RepID=A0A4U8YGI6_9BACT|nr:hypothetical protein [Desulfoluna butyratoxydans]VFQ42475.1 hypothetical protein MSL71_930 [Desulfoluna butyratoxydans]
MTRYIDRETHCELIPGIHEVTDALKFPDGHFLFRPIPEDKWLIWENETPVLQSISATIAELKETLRFERDTKISEAYSPAIQQLTRWIDNNRDAPDARAYYTRQRNAWHAWADALCTLPDQPGFPWPEGEVPWPEQPPRPTPYDATNNG